MLLFKTLQINIMEVEGFIFRNNDDDDNEWEQHSWRRSSDPLAANTPWLPLLMMPDYHHLRVHMLPTNPWNCWGRGWLVHLWKQDHRKWRYRCKLLDYQSPCILPFEITFQSSESLGSSKTWGLSFHLNYLDICAIFPIFDAGKCLRPNHNTLYVWPASQVKPTPFR